ncbi:CRTAC1 family protein [Flavitalea sp. BT771]|uniref:CRTAC1 family protein n=1 Tax=Flavitalea sp. BT771 TaxID=3063329 RepID=UPI0026E2B250|nr:CRTAC1 family protein [Flavitalea sp. BT771]MDO6430320.1 CRTAC1 family protein [Flavitalea sp. BT771]MDV6219540.1 CRTAC1 family protein [Flavitalea sp. BT771]
MSYRPLLFLALISLAACKDKHLPNQEMIDLLKVSARYDHNHENVFSPEAMIEYCDSLLSNTSDDDARRKALSKKANALMQLGEEQKAIDIFQDLLAKISLGNIEQRQPVMKDLAIAYLRMGDRTNCINNHTAESCIFPIAGGGVHRDKAGAEKAIELYKAILADNPGDLESRWLLNVAYMSTGGYPSEVPPQFLLKVRDEDTMHLVKPFRNVAMNPGLNYKCIAGGSIVDDFNNDGYPDIVLSSWSLTEPMRYYRNNANGTFTDVSDSSGLGYLTGGLNIVQTDYNNDGYKDIFVLRGGWKGKFGKNPNSLLRNNGDGTFTDVTKESGLLSFHPSQTAVWADLNNDGWLDVFIGNETTPHEEAHPCQLFINNRNGTFTEMAAKAGCAITLFVKGVTAGDYDNDGLTDIFLSTLNGNKILLRNESDKNGVIKFRDVSEQAGLTHNMTRTFPTWFWDYDNDGWLDILVCGYEFTQSLSYYAAAEAIQLPIGNAGKVFLFRNKHDGTFEEVSAKAGLNSTAFAMGANFGDIDNDGYLDFYLGTGNPQLKSAVPNKLFKNIGGERFLDVTTSARVGNLQKGHGVSFADLDNDGDEDIYIKMGGAYTGDAFENALYLNPGQPDNHWVNLLLQGTLSNKAAIGARIKLTFREHGKERAVFRDVNSGGSFGSNPLRQHIGIGAATTIEQVEISWPVTGKTQVFRNLPIDRNVKIVEGDSVFSTYELSRCDFQSGVRGLISCAPK